MSEKKEKKEAVSKSKFVRNSLGLVILFNILLMSGCYWAKYNQPHIDNSRFVIKTTNEPQPVPHLNTVTITQTIQKNNNTGTSEENKPAKAEPIQKVYETNTIIYPQATILTPPICNTKNEENKACHNHNAGTSITQKDMNGMQEQISNLKLDFADKVGTVGYYTLEILATLFLIISLIITIFGVFGFNFFQNHIEEKFEEAKTKLDASMQYESSLAMASLYLELSYTWWQLCEIVYKPNKKYKIFKNQIETALYFAQKGLEKCKNNVFQEKIYNPKETKALWCYISLLNNMVYFSALIFKHNKGKHSIKKERIIEEINFIFRYAKEPRLIKLEKETKWYENWQSASFALALIGNSEEHDEGKKNLEDLIHNKTERREALPIPSYEWRHNCWEDYELYFPEEILKPEP